MFMQYWIKGESGMFSVHWSAYGAGTENVLFLLAFFSCNKKVWLWFPLFSGRCPPTIMQATIIEV